MSLLLGTLYSADIVFRKWLCLSTFLVYVAGESKAVAKILGVNQVIRLQLTASHGIKVKRHRTESNSSTRTDPLERITRVMCFTVLSEILHVYLCYSLSVWESERYRIA